MSQKLVNTTVQLFLLILFLLASTKKSYSKEFPLRAANVIFLIDQSNSIWHFNFLREIRFVQETIQRFEVGVNYTRVAVATYGENIHVRIRPRNYRNTEGLSKLIGRIKRPHTPRTRLASGLRGFHQIFSNNANYCSEKYSLTKPKSNGSELSRRERLFYQNRREKRQVGESKVVVENEIPLNVVVVLGDGDYSDKDEVQTIVSCLRAEGVSIIAVGVGRNIEVRNLERLANYPPSLFRINISHLDPKVLLQDSVADSKPNKIWEFMMKNRAMSEDCLPHRSRLQLNFVFDIMSQNSWRYPTLVGIAEDMYVRMIKKYQSINRKGDFVRIRFLPNSYSSNQTIHPLDPSTWEEDDAKRFEEVVKMGLEVKTFKKERENASKDRDDSSRENVERNAWDRLSRSINKVIRGVMDEDPPSIQHVVVYVTDRMIEQKAPNAVMLRTKSLVEINKKMASRRKFELFGLALGGFYKISELEVLLRAYQTNPHSRLLAFEDLNASYDRSMRNMVDLFCMPSESQKSKPST